MAKAYSCDWCGEFFRPQLGLEEFFISIPEFTAKLGGDPLDKCSTFEGIHFCPKCSVKFIKIIFGEKAEKVITSEILQTPIRDKDPLNAFIDRGFGSMLHPGRPLD